jgi:cytochrome c peroxidase
VIFTNVAKSIEAYERRLLCENTRFDRVIRGEAVFTEEEERGVVDFIRAGCIDCHGGPQFNTGVHGEQFHNLGLSQDAGAGRATVINTLLENPFNGAGSFSDNPDAGAQRLARLNQRDDLIAAFKTPSLRGVSQRPRFFHDGSHTSIQQVLNFYRDNGRRRRRGRNPVGIISSEFDNLGRFNDEAIEAFLQTLDCPKIDPDLIDPDIR